MLSDDAARSARTAAQLPPLALHPLCWGMAAWPHDTERRDGGTGAIAGDDDVAMQPKRRDVCRLDAAAVMFFPRADRPAGAAAADAGGPGRG